MLSKQYICYYNDIPIKSKLPKSIKGSLWLHPFVKKLITHHHKPNKTPKVYKGIFVASPLCQKTNHTSS